MGTLLGPKYMLYSYMEPLRIGTVEVGRARAQVAAGAGHGRLVGECLAPYKPLI